MTDAVTLLDQVRRQLLATGPADAQALLAHFITRSHELTDQNDAARDLCVALESGTVPVDVVGLCGTTLAGLDMVQHANTCWEKLLAIDPSQEAALLKLVVGRRKCCDWRDFDSLANQLRRQTVANLQRGRPPIETVLLSLSTSMDREYQHALARAWATNRGRHYPAAYRHDRSAAGRIDPHRITIGYISDELRDHPVGHLLRDYFPHHDRERFRVIAYFDHRPDDTDAVYRSIRAGCEEARLVVGLDHRALAEQIYRDGVDIFIDLKGWRENNRLAAFALRPAPIGVAFQGYPGTTGAAYMDYIVVDDTVVPPHETGTYTESLAYIGRCYQADSTTQPPFDDLCLRAGTRQSHGLPHDAVVLASFNQAYKLDPHMMKLWLDVMRQAERTVLWLLELTPACRVNLQRFAAQHGVAAERLVFAPWADRDAHLARLTHADVALDTRTYTGHATTTDAVWCRVPVVTMLGQHFASRVSASILREVGWDELVTHDLAGYRDLALRLIRDVQFRAALRAKMTTAHLEATLFNTRDYVRRVEDLFLQMMERYRQGEPPQMIHCRL